MAIACTIGAVRSVAATTDDPASDTYWQTHSLVLASVTGFSETKGERPKTGISLRPKLRLSGTLDPGKVPELSAEVDPRLYGKEFKLPSAGAFVLVVLVKNGDVYIVSHDRPAFMPGDHAPICEVKDLDDPKFSEALKAVQELRKKKQTDQSSKK